MDSLEITNELQFDLDNFKKNAAITWKSALNSIFAS